MVQLDQPTGKVTEEAEQDHGPQRVSVQAGSLGAIRPANPPSIVSKSDELNRERSPDVAEAEFLP
jgi:hypothetical protein